MPLGPPPRPSGLRVLARALRRGDPLAWSAPAGAFVLAAYPAYWLLTTVRPLWAGSRGHAADFLIYFDAGRRVLADPLTLYAADTFIYPPPSGAMFAVAALMPLEVGYLVVAALNVALLAACVRLGESLHPDPPRGWARAALWATALGWAPVIQNVKFGQVGPLILLASMLFLRWLPTRPARAGVVLALGVWLKLYPAVLGAFALRKRSWPAVAAGAAVAVAVPLATLPLFPPSLYTEYVQDVLPTVTGQTVTAALNVGLPATVERLSLPADRVAQYAPLPMSPAAEWAGRLALLLGVGAALVAWSRGWPTAWAGLSALAAVPVASPFAWEYTFLLAVPMAMAALLTARRGGPWVRGLAAAAALVLFVQKPPEYAVVWLVAVMPGAVMDLFAARVLIALAVLGGCAVAVRRRERVAAPPGPPLAADRA